MFHAWAHSKRNTDTTQPTAAEGSTGSTLNCGINGYKVLVNDIMNLVLLLFTLYFSTVTGLLSAMGMDYLAISLRLFYDFVKGVSSW